MGQFHRQGVEFYAEGNVRHSPAAPADARRDFGEPLVGQRMRRVQVGHKADQRHRLRLNIPPAVDDAVVGHAEDIVTCCVVRLDHLVKIRAAVAGGRVGVEVGFVGAPGIPVDGLVGVGYRVTLGALDVAGRIGRDTQRRKQRGRQQEGKRAFACFRMFHVSKIPFNKLIKLPDKQG